MKSEAKFALTGGDKSSQTWLRLVEHLTERREFFRGQLESDVDETTTARLRARISLIKELIALGKTEDRNTD